MSYAESKYCWLVTVLIICAAAPLQSWGEDSRVYLGEECELIMTPTKGGYLPALQISVGRAGMSSKTFYQTHVRRIFDYADVNGDAAIDEKEFVRLPSMRDLRELSMVGVLPMLGQTLSWKQLDADSSGSVNAIELETHFRGLGYHPLLITKVELPASGQLTESLIRQWDTNADGALSKREIVGAVDRISGIDQNDDELIGAGELVQGLKYPGVAATRLVQNAIGDDAKKLVGSVTPDEFLKLKVEMNSPSGLSSVEIIGHTKSAESSLKSICAVVGQGAARQNHEESVKWIRSVYEKADLDHNGSLESVEIDQKPDASYFAEMIRRADSNSDRCLQASELDALLKLSEYLAADAVQVSILTARNGLFELLDTHRDGALSRREILNAWQTLENSGCVEGGRVIGSKIPNVVLLSVSAGPSVNLLGSPEMNLPDWFTALDRNKDGDISRREFSGSDEIWRTLDKDADGLLSSEEGRNAKP